MAECEEFLNTLTRLYFLEWRIDYHTHFTYFSIHEIKSPQILTIIAKTLNYMKL